MPTESTVSSQDRILQAVYAGQEASVNAARQWSEAVATVVPRLPELMYPEKPEQAFSFATRLWAAQFEFATKVAEAVAGPLVQSATQGAPNAAATAAAKAGATR